MLADNSTTKSRRSTEIGRIVVRATVDIYTSSKVKRSEVKVTRPLIAETKNQPYLRKWKTYKLQTWYMDGEYRHQHHSCTSVTSSCVKMPNGLTV